MIYLNGERITFKQFPNNETELPPKAFELERLKGNETNEIGLKYETDACLMHLRFVKRYLDSHGIASHLLIHYMPYSRMDRIEGNSAFTLEYVADFINEMNFPIVRVVEPHSIVTLELLHRSVAIYPTMHLLAQVEKEVGFDRSKDVLFFPDKGAGQRYGNIPGYYELVGNKKRDFETGRITSLDIVDDPPYKDFTAIIVDDLSSYGGTFLMGAEALRLKGAKRVFLLITHAENALLEGKIPTSPLIDGVFATNSMLAEANHPKFKIFDLETVLKEMKN